MSFLSRDNFSIPLRGRILSWTVAGQAQHHIRLKPGKFTVGRLDSNDIFIDQETVSRRHAQLTLEGQELFVEDLASTQGTWIGGTRLKPYTRTPVPPATPVWIGEVALTYQPEQAMQIPIIWIVGVAGTLLLVAACVVLVNFIVSSYKPPASTFTCAESSYLISLPDQDVLPPKSLPTSTQASAGEASATPAETGATPGPEVTPTEGLVVSDSIQFLDLPFPYNGTSQCGAGTDAQFFAAIQRAWEGGRIYSFFDHNKPIYSYETSDESHKVLIFTGQVTQDNYSGHDGYDFIPVDPESHNTRVCAPAAGIISEAGTREDIGNYIVLLHHINGIDYKTLYGHLFRDQYFDETRMQVGKSVRMYDPIATMDNTGKNTTGSHLHFKVSIFLNGNWYPVDPFGYIPSTTFPADTWNAPSYYLWVHRYPTTQFKFPTTSGNKPETAQGSGGETLFLPKLCAPRNAVPSGGVLNFSLSLSPLPAKDRVTVAKALTLSVQDAQGNILPQFNQPIQFMIPFTEDDLKKVKPGTITIRRLNEAANEWEYVASVKDQDHFASASVTQPGQYALLGEPVQEQILPPKTVITAHGLKIPGGVWCDAVEVSISAKGDAPIAEITFSFRDDMTTQAYDGPLVRTLQSEGKPAEVSTSDQEFGFEYPIGNSRYLVLAKSRDNLGSESMPTVLYVVIDPTLAKAQCEEETLTVGN